MFWARAKRRICGSKIRPQHTGYTQYKKFATQHLPWWAFANVDQFKTYYFSFIHHWFTCDSPLHLPRSFSWSVKEAFLIRPNWSDDSPWKERNASILSATNFSCIFFRYSIDVFFNSSKLLLYLRSNFFCCAYNWAFAALTVVECCVRRFLNRCTW